MIGGQEPGGRAGGFAAAALAVAAVGASPLLVTDGDNSKKCPSNKPASAYVLFSLRYVNPRPDVGAR